MSRHAPLAGLDGRADLTGLACQVCLAGVVGLFRLADLAGMITPTYPPRLAWLADLAWLAWFEKLTNWRKMTPHGKKNAVRQFCQVTGVSSCFLDFFAARIFFAVLDSLGSTSSTGIAIGVSLLGPI